MFGFVCIDKQELKVKEYESYKAVYCSLCRQLTRDYSFLSGFLLNFDCTFYAMMCMASSDVTPLFSRKRCRYNPLKRCNYCESGQDFLSKSAALLILMSYYKLLDNINDSGFFKRIGCIILKPLFSMWKRKAAAMYPHIHKACEQMYLSQCACEEKDACIDEAAEPTARLLAEVFSELSDSEKLRPAYEQFGYHLGKWVYLMDAIDDLDDDVKSGSFNPVYNKLRKTKAESVEYADGLLSQSLFLLTGAYRLIPKKHFGPILDNIILLGLVKKQEEVLYSERKNK